MQALVELVLAYLQDMVMQPGIARAPYMKQQSESLAAILSGSHAAIFLIDMHGEEHTDEIGMHTVLCSLQRTSCRDARQASARDQVSRTRRGRSRRMTPGAR